MTELTDSIKTAESNTRIYNQKISDLRPFPLRYRLVRENTQSRIELFIMEHEHRGELREEQQLEYAVTSCSRADESTLLHQLREEASVLSNNGYNIDVLETVEQLY